MLMQKRTKEIIFDFSVAIIISILFTLIFKLSNLDITLQNIFYSTAKNWKFGSQQPWNFFYHYGNYPVLLFIIISLIFLIVSFWKNTFKWLFYRKAALFFILVLLLGPGLLVNGVLKEHVGRPRPREIINYGGTDPFVPVLKHGTAGKGKSFPCGHCSMAFMLITPFFVLRKKYKLLSLLVLSFGLIYSLLMSLARMAQGGHFASDAIWAGIIVYFSSLIIYYILQPNRVEKTQKTISRKKMILLICSSLFLMGGIIFGVALATPYYKEFSVTPNHKKISNFLQFYFKKGSIHIKHSTKTSLKIQSQGFGLPESEIIPQWNYANGMAIFKLKKIKGLFTELNHNVNLNILNKSTNSIKLEYGEIDYVVSGSGVLNLTNLHGNIKIRTGNARDYSIKAISPSVISNASLFLANPRMHITAVAPNGKIIVTP